MTSPWPAAPKRPASRPTSLVAVVIGVVLAAVAQLSTIAVLGTTAVAWAGRTPPAAPFPGLSPTPIQSPTPTASPTPTVQQTTGPVDVTDDVQRGLVLIAGRTGNEGVAGTGMVLTPDGFVLTNYHVVRSTSSVSATVAPTGRTYKAKLVGRDATKDVALLKLEGAQDLKVIAHDRDPVAVGDAVVAAGNANGQGYVTANRGNIQALNTSISVRSASENDPPVRLRGLIQTNAPAWPGDSGGPMFDAEGEVLGMTTAGGSDDNDERDKQVYAVPIDAAMKVVEQIRAGDESGTVVIGPKAYLGVVVRADDAAQAVVVTRVEDGTPAAKAGIRSGDTISSVNGTAITSRSDLSTVLDKVEPGSTIPIGWTTAAGRERTGQVTVGTSSIN
ncbi:PDZ domain-containing protein [Propioniciclava coleopterorum]|uniref:PDZ domain-containing protein n=1 Tax=Propioniciclava coleopterorum TaxID=2714937 RepID=A0A6G7Y4J1_9ACTN|nr:trypsin-like peptidase domain-containing protein [Propioniciclava coleopterorum]QIK71804.1 PDZ domain-containing protein [Propioniciclava coleopterorum]